MSHLFKKISSAKVKKSHNYQWGVEIELGVLQSLGFPGETAASAPRVVEGIGVKKATARRANDRCELLILYMDTKRRPDEAWKKQAGRKVIAHIRKFSPDVAILADDNAQAHVGRHIVASVPVVFCGVNAEYTTYYGKSDNVTGLHERMNYAGSLRLLQRICPEVRSIVYLTDNTPTSKPAFERIRKTSLPLPLAAAHVCRDFEEYKRRVLHYQKRPDVALALFNLNFADVTQEETIAWTLRNSKIPDVTFQRNTVEGGLLCASIVSAERHGQMAGEFASRILNGQPASAIPVTVPPRGEDIVNLVRARALGKPIGDEIRRSVKTVAFATALHGGEKPVK